MPDLRKSSQYLMPVRKPPAVPGKYDIYPTHHLGNELISESWEALASLIRKHPVVFIDGYQGIFFENYMAILREIFSRAGVTVRWTDVSTALKKPHEIDRLTEPFLGGNDPLFGKKAALELSDFFDHEKLAGLLPDPSFNINIFYGTGAALKRKNEFLIYIDLPKNELQYRARAGSVTNLGAPEPGDFQAMYKRFYFIDWVVLNRHKQKIFPFIDVIADGQRFKEITWASGKEIREGLKNIGRTVFRTRPWFEPGPWGGRWCRENIPGLNGDVPNYAWSFELIVPENGLVFESSGIMLEVSFDCLMFMEAEAVMGACYNRYRTEFPIRFDFLDTFEGGNLSVQCHPLPEYIRNEFGENIAQEECYYILDARKDSEVFLGFREDINPDKFEKALRESFDRKTDPCIENYVMKLPSARHDLFLIPPGTVHASGKNNLVLEISTTPYIFTFKMYDWLRPDLNGNLRPLNISRAMKNLQFGRKGEYVRKYLVSKPELTEKRAGGEIYRLPTHEKHSYGVNRIHLKNEIELPTNNRFHVFNVVDGGSVEVETATGGKNIFSYAETFVIPAAAGSFILRNRGKNESVLVNAFIKDTICSEK